MTGRVLKMRTEAGEARAVQTSEGVCLLTGSAIRPGHTPTCPAGAIKRREAEAASIKRGITTKPLIFGSLSGAAAFVAGRSIQGPVAWTPVEPETPIISRGARRAK